MSDPWWDEEEDDYLSISPRFILPNLGDTEDIEKYAPGGFHPVHLGDDFDNGRYVVMHKLGAGGFATVWLARDKIEGMWVALKIIVAQHSASINGKTSLNLQAISRLSTQPTGTTELRRFHFKGPNGTHLCLVLSVLGPSMSRLSSGFTSRLKPWLSRRASYLATKAVAAMHSQGLCHGDITTANILFTLDIGDFDEDCMYRLFGPPVTKPLETESGEPAGPEAPRYIVKALDFLSSASNIITNNVALIDLDQSFPISSPPEKMLGITVEFLAPEVAVGLPASPASDVWALGCCIFRLRSGEGPFSNYEVTSPADLMKIIHQTIGTMPIEWQDTLWDYYGQPTKDPKRGRPLSKWPGERPLKDLVHHIWDQPEGNIVQTGTTRPGRPILREDQKKPFPPCFSNMVWKPTAVRVDNVNLYGYNKGSEELLEAMPKIAELEATLLYDLLSKIFVYDPAQRLTAKEMLDHPWFHLDGQLD
ncbi:kinase domain-containing protein [Nemania sp. FL0031]|nr:kinase domain-containing protein [Nemania sp. FL0031]